MRLKQKLILGVMILLSLNSCISLKKHKAVLLSNEALKEQSLYFKDSLDKSNKLLLEYQMLLQNSKNEIDILASDTTLKADKIKFLTLKNAELKTTIDLLSLSKNKEYEKTTAKIAELQNKIDEREKGLDLLAAELEIKRIELEEAMLSLKEKEKQSEEMNKKLQEMELLLKNYKNATEDLRKKVSDALVGFENSGLSIKVKNGKVYISLEESLLFQSGSTKIDKKGEDALKKLAKILENNPDISVMIEGHTDNIPYIASSGCIKNNWELSVLRATTIVETLLKFGKIEPLRIIAAGRAESLPLDNENTKEARAKNRRTEIILTPKLDELFKIIESN